MEIFPMSIASAMEFLKEHERHYKSDATPVFAIGIRHEGNVCGAAIMGSRGEDAELCHIYSVGEYYGYTVLYGAMWRSTKAMGYKKLVL